MGIPFVGVPLVGVPKVVGGVLLFALSSFRFNASREFRSRIAGLTEVYSQYFTPQYLMMQPLYYQV